MRKPAFCICAQLLSAFVFATRIEQLLHFLNPKFQASSVLLWLYSPVCVGPGRKSRRPVFSQRGSFHSRVNVMYQQVSILERLTYESAFDWIPITQTNHKARHTQGVKKNSWKLHRELPKSCCKQNLLVSVNMNNRLMLFCMSHYKKIGVQSTVSSMTLIYERFFIGFEVLYKYRPVNI